MSATKYAKIDRLNESIQATLKELTQQLLDTMAENFELKRQIVAITRETK